MNVNVSSYRPGFFFSGVYLTGGIFIHTTVGTFKQEEETLEVVLHQFFSSLSKPPKIHLKYTRCSGYLVVSGMFGSL